MSQFITAVHKLRFFCNASHVHSCNSQKNDRSNNIILFSQNQAAIFVLPRRIILFYIFTNFKLLQVVAKRTELDGTRKVLVHWHPEEM
jgi:hypothetical protein